MPIVGIGASAGGLEAFTKFFDAMPPDAGLAFVLIQHLDPVRESHMAELLARHTSMPVAEVADGMRVEPNHVYVIRPDRYLTIHGGVLRLTPPASGQHLVKPIDAFFHSLAQDRQEKSIAIILSGTGNNGSVGLRSIKANGGMAMAQDPATAQHDGMPASAIATGLADFILPPEKMPGALVEYVRHPHVRGAGATEALSPEAAGRVDSLLALVRERTGRDFRCYKKSTLIRRLHRRMGLKHVEHIADYLELVRKDPAEADALAQELMINVTSFFRDPEAWEALRTAVLAPLVRNRDVSSPIRVWVPGCATGEEAYTVAMLLAQEAQAARRSVEIRVFATDVDRTALEEARLGVYPAGIAECVPPKRLARFFEKQGDTFRVAKRIRESLVFSVQDVLRDPPFSRLDLITCRNLLIYLETDVQQKVLALFHFALGEGGYLMLGNAETVGRQEDLFKPISKKWRIYRRLGPVRIGRVDFPVAPPAPRPATAAPPGPWPQQRASPADLALQALAAQYAPAAVLVDHHYQALYFHGPTERYLTPPQGVSTRDLLAMAREGLHTKLRAALRTAVKTHRTATAAGARVKRNGTTRGVTVHVTPLKAGADAEGLLLVSFEDEPAARGAPHPRPSITEKALVRQLEHELKVVQQELQGTLREMEGANEQLKVSNEEVISMNEELQSSNEELETSKEELQSLNEELSTVNTQLQAKVDELQEANETVTNLLASTDIATLFLDKAGRIRWFSPAAGKLLNLLAADVGRPVSHFAQKLTAGDLPADAAATLENLAPVEKELRTDDGRWYLRRVFPYRTQDGKVEGVVVTFTEITALRHSQEKERRLATVVRDSNDAILVLDLKGAIVAWNRGAEQMYRCTAAEAIGRHIREFIPEDKVKEFEEILARLAAGIAVPSWEAQRRTGDGRVLDVWITASPLAGDAGPIEAIATTERNITARKYTEAQLRRLNEALERQVAERTRVAEHRAEQLRTLAMRLAQTESRERRRLARHLHDNIQQILTGTRFYVNVLKRKTQDDETREATQSIEALLGEALEALRSLTLELSPPVLYEAGLGAGLQWLARWCHGKLGLKVDVRADPAAEPPTEDIRIMLFSAVRELLFNVRKHAHVDAARVTLGLADKDFIAVTVSDEGQGFDPDRIDAGNEDTSASGLGLFGIRERLSAWGGDVKVEASPGHGARVTLLMPVEHLARFARRPELLTAEAPGPAAQPAGATPDGAAVSTGRARGRAAQAAIPGKIRTLLVDDHRVVRQALARLLAEEPDIEVVGEADDGKAATELVRVIRPDVVVMDVSMPGMNGIDATAAITKEFPDIRVIGLSMHGEGDLPAKILDAGAVTCLGKGGPSDDLVAAIRAAGKAAPPDGHPPKR